MKEIRYFGLKTSAKCINVNVYIENCVLCFAKIVYEIETESKAVSGFVDLVLLLFVSAFRNCVTSTDFVCKQLKENLY